MTLKEMYEAVLIEIDKDSAPNLLLEDFNYYARKASYQYVNKRYNVYDTSLLTGDDLHVLKSNAIIKINDENNLVKERYNMWSTLLPAVYEFNLPSDYFHLLSCECFYELAKPYKCYRQGNYVHFPATRLTADISAKISTNAWLKPDWKRPYYYIHNINTQDEFPYNPYNKESKTGNDIPEVLPTSIANIEEYTRELSIINTFLNTYNSKKSNLEQEKNNLNVSENTQLEINDLISSIAEKTNTRSELSNRVTLLTQNINSKKNTLSVLLLNYNTPNLRPDGEQLHYVGYYYVILTNTYLDIINLILDEELDGSLLLNTYGKLPGTDTIVPVYWTNNEDLDDTPSENEDALYKYSGYINPNEIYYTKLNDNVFCKYTLEVNDADELIANAIIISEDEMPYSVLAAEIREILNTVENINESIEVLSTEIENLNNSLEEKRNSLNRFVEINNELNTLNTVKSTYESRKIELEEYLNQNSVKDANNYNIADTDSADVFKVALFNGDYSNVERSPQVRYGNPTNVRCEIRYGTDNSVFKLKQVQIDYVKVPLYLELTQEQLDKTEDTSQVLEFPDYICLEIVNELIHLIMEKDRNDRIQTHPVVSLSIATQQLAPVQQQNNN